MFDGLRYWWAIRKLQRARRRIIHTFEISYDHAASEDERSGLVDHRDNELLVKEEEIAILRTERLLQQAEQYLIEPPLMISLGNIPDSNT